MKKTTFFKPKGKKKIKRGNAKAFSVNPEHSLEEVASNAKISLIEMNNEPLVVPISLENDQGFTRWESVEQFRTFSPNLKRDQTATNVGKKKVFSGRIRSHTQAAKPEINVKQPEQKHRERFATITIPNEKVLGRQIRNVWVKGRVVKPRVINPNSTIQSQFHFVLPRSIPSTKRVRLNEYANFYRHNPMGFQRTKHLEILLATKLDSTTQERVKQIGRLHTVYFSPGKTNKKDTFQSSLTKKEPLDEILKISNRLKGGHREGQGFHSRVKAKTPDLSRR